MKKRFNYLMLCSIILIMTACQMNSHTDIDKESEEESIVENKSKDDLMPEKVVLVGIEGYEEEIEFQSYQNEWIKLWTDPSLHKSEEENELHFYNQGNEVSFSVKRLETSIPDHDLYEEVDNEMAVLGYELMSQFDLETKTKTGTGYIFYSFDERQSIDVYWLRDEEQNYSIQVQFVIPEVLSEQYTPRFEYMMESIELTSM